MKVVELAITVINLHVRSLMMYWTMNERWDKSVLRSDKSLLNFWSSEIRISADMQTKTPSLFLIVWQHWCEMTYSPKRWFNNEIIIISSWTYLQNTHLKRQRYYYSDEGSKWEHYVKCLYITISDMDLSLRRMWTQL